MYTKHKKAEHEHVERFFFVFVFPFIFGENQERILVFFRKRPIEAAVVPI